MRAFKAQFLELLQRCASVTGCRNAELHQGFLSLLFADEGRVSGSAVGSFLQCSSVLPKVLSIAPSESLVSKVSAVVKHLHLSAAEKDVSLQLISARG